MFRLIRECRPDWVVGENVAGLINLGLDEVLSDLEGEGYATRTFNIPACAVGAPHIRQRLWIVAHSDSESEPDGAFDGNAGERQLGFGFGGSEATSHGADSNEPRSHRTQKHKQNTKHGQTQLRDKQVRESGSVGGHVADTDSDDGGREGSSKSLGRETRLEHSGSSTQRAVANANKNGRKHAAREGDTQQYKASGERSIGVGGSGKHDVADTQRKGKGGRRVPRPGKDKSEDRQGSSDKFRGCREDVADAREVHGQWSDSQGSQQRQDKESLGERGSGMADAKRTGTGVEEHRGSGQGRESAQASQPEVLRQEDGASGAEGIAANGNGSEDWWAVEPDVGRVAHGVPARVAQLRALGNSVVPQIAQEIGKAIHAAETQ
jgi:site-specific DNA-cytosine methylase